MLQNFNTNKEENFNEEVTKVTIKVEVKEEDASHVLALFNAPAPQLSEIDEIHLIIKRKKSA